MPRLASLTNHIRGRLIIDHHALRFARSARGIKIISRLLALA
ncbi:Uncharacterised protein [Vibrio cholerae]|nr:Uncharacterised protein [Vibrio cholerae]